MVPWLPFFITLPLSFIIILIPRTPMNRLLADGASLPGLSEPGVHTAAVVGMSTGEDPKLVPILILVQTDCTDIILVSLLIVMSGNLFQLLFGKSIPLEPFPVLDTTNYHDCSHGQNQ